MNYTARGIILKILIILCALNCATAQADINTYFNSINQDPKALYSFFKNMPKGGELHYHLAGSSYAETMLELASTGNYCINKDTFAITNNTSACHGVTSNTILSQPTLVTAVIKSWSMKDFIPGIESGHDHFFNSFAKYMPIVINYSPQLLVDIMQRAAQQHELYMEIMILPDNARSIQFSSLLKSTKSFKKMRARLLADKTFLNNITYSIQESERLLKQAHQQLGCTTPTPAKACSVKVNFLYYILREQPINSVFAQALTAFEAVSRAKSNLVGVNLVQPEDGFISLRDYHQQMSVFHYLHQRYPQVKIALHAGELAPNLVAAKELTYHIHDALLTGQALRIGHGVDITHERDAQATLKYMREHQIPVEINLISNLKILNIAGSGHPLNYYLAHQVPVVLSTDDEGILRTDLTQQYVEAVLAHGLNYPALKLINRNTLTYAFLPGKSIWSNAHKATLVPACNHLNSQTCHQFIQHNEKAKLQWQLESALSDFERRF
ncbi:MAG: adenosine deaminase [Legionellales bacterium]